MQVASDLYEWLGSFHAERNNPVIAVGGGVVGDISGFVAATYLRGMPFVQVPTSMLAMMDASIGGKTAVNFNQIKNKLGVFYHPQSTLIIPDFLKTLPEFEINSGFGEIFKYALIKDKKNLGNPIKLKVITTKTTFSCIIENFYSSLYWNFCINKNLNYSANITCKNYTTFKTVQFQ